MDHILPIDLSLSWLAAGIACGAERVGMRLGNVRLSAAKYLRLSLFDFVTDVNIGCRKIKR